MASRRDQAQAYRFLTRRQTTSISGLAMMAAVPKWCATVSKAPATRPAIAATTTILPKTVTGRENQ